MMKLLLILSVTLNLIPAPVEYSPEKSHTRFRKEIAKLEKLAWAEKQPKKKYELVQQVSALKKQLEAVT